jgi:hypothetical protein
MLTERLAAGVHVRLCFGEPNSRAVGPPMGARSDCTGRPCMQACSAMTTR